MAAPTARRRRASLVKQRGAVYYENFSVNGRRFRECLGTGDRDLAESLAAQKKAAALLGKITGQKPDILLKQAVVRHWSDVAQHWRSARQAQMHNRTLIKFLGAETVLAELDFGRLASFVAERRGTLENASVNRELGHLRGMVNACADWGYRIPEIPWQRLWLDEPQNKQTLLPQALEAQFFAALRPDFHAPVKFGLMTGLRRENVLGLRWDAIDWDAGTITLRVKSKKPGRKLHVVELTAGMRALLSVEEGRHPDFVFTYVCEHGGKGRRRGRRYPLGLESSNFRRDWARARAAVGLPTLRFHDLRHTFGTRLAKLAPLGVVQRALGHANIQTTMRYASSDQVQVREALERLEAQTQRAELAQIRHSPVAGEPKKQGNSSH